MVDTDGYNGWANYETWNVALWIGNDEGLYSMAREYRSTGYKAFAQAMREVDEETPTHVNSITLETPDGVAWNDSGLDIKALDEMMGEL
jgi:hypothetical protein